MVVARLRLLSRPSPMGCRGHDRVRVLLLGALLLFPGLLLLHGIPGHCESLWREDEQRVRLGLKLFPACLGALESLDEQLTPDGALLILVVYAGSDTMANQVVASLASLAEIRGHRLAVRALAVDALDGYTGSHPAGIFIASVGLAPERIRAWSQRYRTLVFSPFAGAVEDGAVAGIYIADRILPQVNLAQARRARLELKSFFLDVARRYEGD